MRWSNPANRPSALSAVESSVADRLIDQLLEQINTLYTKYPPSKVVVDTGGLGKKIAESLKQRYGLPLEAADKKRKLENYALLNNALRTGSFMAPKTSKFAQDCNILEKDRDKSTPEKIIVKGHSDAVDSVLYAFKESPAYSYVNPPPKPTYGTPEWNYQEQERMREALLEEIRREQQSGEDMYGLFDTSQPDLSKWKRAF